MELQILQGLDKFSVNFNLLPKLLHSNYYSSICILWSWYTTENCGETNKVKYRLRYRVGAFSSKKYTTRTNRTTKTKNTNDRVPEFEVVESELRRFEVESELRRI